MLVLRGWCVQEKDEGEKGTFRGRRLVRTIKRQRTSKKKKIEKEGEDKTETKRVVCRVKWKVYNKGEEKNESRRVVRMDK